MVDRTLITITMVLSIVAAGLALCPSYCYPPHRVPRITNTMKWNCDSCPSNVPTCPCYLPKIVGQCRAAIPRFHFNSETGICEQFLYGGCGGNGNNYETKLECEQACINVCAFPIVPGGCSLPESLSVRPAPAYGFNGLECVRFIAWPCGPRNDNRFGTLTECENTCEI